MRGYYSVTVIMASLTVVFIAARVFVMKKTGIKPVRFGERDKKDFILIPFMMFFFYLIYASAFSWPAPGSDTFYRYYVHWYGSAACFIGLVWIAASVIALGTSFRIGIDDGEQMKLITKGPFAINRNPLYTGFLFLFAGVYITFTNWIFLIYFIVGAFMINRQIVREEAALKIMFGDEYIEYCKRVRRYL